MFAHAGTRVLTRLSCEKLAERTAQLELSEHQRERVVQERDQARHAAADLQGHLSTGKQDIEISQQVRVSNRITGRNV